MSLALLVYELLKVEYCGCLRVKLFREITILKFMINVINKVDLYTQMIEFTAPLAAFVIALLSSQAGISGAFLILPMQITLLGVNPAITSSTNFVYNLVAIPSGLYGYWKEKRLFLPLSNNDCCLYSWSLFGSIVQNSFSA